MDNFSIKNWSEDDRPREKLLLKGKNALSNSELMAILIGSGNRDESAVALSKRILTTIDDDLNQLAKMSVADLIKFKGIGEAKAVSIVTALELGRRQRLQESMELSKITCSKDIFNLMHPIIGELSHEEFWIIFLNNANKVIGKQQLSKGGITATVVDVRLLFKRVLEVGATNIILCHNHPAGTLKPSKQDVNITEKLKNAGTLLDVKVLDHLIVTDKDYYSFADEGVV